MKRFYKAVKVGSVAYLFLSCSLVFAQSSEEKDFLSMYFKEEDLVVETATRNPQPLSQVAENMTVVSAADIERMNAHTLADVLNTVTGVEVWFTGGPGQLAQASILGSATNRVTVLMDGVVLNDVNTNLAFVGQFPVQNIEKIEIIKGPASSAWGSALGGVINVITKSGRSIDQGGMLSASYGTKNFGDLRAETRGKQGGLAYYLTAGRLQSGDLTPEMGLWNNNAYAKFGYDLTDQTKVQLSMDYIGYRLDGGLFWSTDTSKYNGSYMQSALALSSILARDVIFDLSIRISKQPFTRKDFSSGTFIYSAKDIDSGYGESAKITWKSAIQTAVLGFDGDNRTNEDPVLPNGKQHVNRWGLYANDTMAIGRFTFTPGFRFDRTNLNGSFTSPSFGMTLKLMPETILRAFAARGFNNPTPGDTFGDGVYFLPNPDLKMESVESYQAGVESGILKYIWTKLTFFRDDIDNALDYSTSKTLNIGHVSRKGVEVQAKTAPFHGLSLAAGAEFITTEDANTHETIHDLPTQVYDVALVYNQDSWDVLLQGRHINWNAREEEQSKYHSMLIDMNIGKKIFDRGNSLLEVFATVHNLLNADQYLQYVYPNPERWYEAGVRYKF